MSMAGIDSDSLVLVVFIDVSLESNVVLISSFDYFYFSTEVIVDVGSILSEDESN